MTHEALLDIIEIFSLRIIRETVRGEETCRGL